MDGNRYNAYGMNEHKQLDYYRLETGETLAELKTTADGLSPKEAARRLRDWGRNELQVKVKRPAIFTYFSQFRDLMIILLLVSSALALYLNDGRTALVLFLLVILNTTIGFLQEFKAEKVMESLERLVVAKAMVKRNGKLVEIPSAELVSGDIAYIEEGVSVPADMRIISEEELSTNDFALTGESNPSRKFMHAISGAVPLSGRQNLVFMGTTVATGNGYGVVIATGMHTELGRIASLSQGINKESSPLQREMNHIAKRVTQGTIILCLILLPIAIQTGLPFKDAFLFAIGFACSIVPNGLPAAISTSLARAAGKLVKAKALVKKLSAVESLGATSVICTDKTGTLTKNQMTVEQFRIGQTAYRVSGVGYEPQGAIQDEKNRPLTDQQRQALELFLTTGAFASNARVNPPDDEHPVWHCLGDPTEGALITLAMKAGLDVPALEKQYPEISEFPFDSARKRMSSIRHYGPDKQLYVFVKGAPESVLERSTRIWDHGKLRTITAEDRKRIQSENETLGRQAMRNLALAYRIMPAKSRAHDLKLDETEQELVWLGMVSMIDPLREQVPAAMQAARRAHMKVSIVTGDNAVTATAIAVRAKLAEKPEDIVVVAGEELEKLGDSRILELASRGGVIFSRVAPEDKLRIVSLVQDSGQVVAVTGDGINDAPALKRADIGVAMGQTGTDVAKQSAEIILLDDSFDTLVGTVQEGRVIFQNIKKVTICCFSGNAAELMTNLFSLAGATLFHIPLAITIIQILAIDLIAELLPVAALGSDKADHNLMRERPRDPKDHIINRASIVSLLWVGTVIGGLAFLNFLWFFERNGVSPRFLATNSDLYYQATALTYLTLVLCLLVNVLMRRSRRGLFTRYQLHNRALWLAMAISLFSIVNIIYNPWLTAYFHTAPLGLVDWLTALGATLLFIVIIEFQRYTKRHSRQAVLELHRSHSLRKPS